MPAKSSNTSLIGYIESLSKVVADRWRARHFDAEAFPEIATSALEELPASAHIEPRQLLEWAVTTDPLPAQDGPNNRFGEPAIRLFDNGRFFIQALFWFDGTTSIHQHSFSGAFEVLTGSSIHCQYHFEPSLRYNENLQLGQLSFDAVELLGRGAVRSIFNGSRFVHSLFHLEYPSVSFLVRTHNEAEAGPLYSYLRPGIAFNTFHVTPRMRMTQEVLAAAAKGPKGGIEQLAASALRDADAESALHMLLSCRELFPAEDWPRLSPEMIRLVASRSEQLWRTLVPQMLAEQERVHLMVGCRKHVRDRELRFFLGLLMNVPSKTSVLELVGTKFGGDPIERIVGWVERLWATPLETEGGSAVNMLQFECEDRVKAPALAILTALLQGQSEETIVRSRQEYRGVYEICQLWREQPFLQPLLET